MGIGDSDMTLDELEQMFDDSSGHGTVIRAPQQCPCHPPDPLGQCCCPAGRRPPGRVGSSSGSRGSGRPWLPRPRGAPGLPPGGTATNPGAHRVPGVISTGFPALDAILGPSGLPPEASVAVRGGPSSGKTTLALRCVAEAQASGDIVAWLDLGRAFDPVEAVGRGVDLRWLLVIRPADAQEGLGLAGALLTGRCVGLLVVDLPARLRARLDDQLRRLAAHARRVGARLVVLEPASLSGLAWSSAGAEHQPAAGAGAAGLAAPGAGRGRAAHGRGRGQEPLWAAGPQRGPGHPLPRRWRALAGDPSAGYGRAWRRWPLEVAEPGPLEPERPHRCTAGATPGRGVTAARADVPSSPNHALAVPGLAAPAVAAGAGS